MRNIRRFLTLFCFIAVCGPLYTNCAPQGSGFESASLNSEEEFTGYPLPDTTPKPATNLKGWRQLKLGAGGWVAGIDMSNDGTTKVVRTDTFGGYVWDAKKMAWKMITTSIALPPGDVGPMLGTVVYEMRVAPKLPTRIYMAYANRVFRSDDRGLKFMRTGLAPVDLGSGCKTCGQRMVVDPNDSNVVYLGTPKNGMFVTFNGGTSWQQVAGVTSPTDPGVSGLVIDGASGTVGGRSKTIYAAATGVGVYRSLDAGVTWTLTTGGPLNVAHGKLGIDGTYYANGDDYKKIWRYANGSWTEITPLGGRLWSSIAIDPANANRLIAVRDDGALAISNNRGTVWSDPIGSVTRTAFDIPWLGWTNESWMSAGDIMVDPASPTQLWFTQGIGVWTYELTAAPMAVNWISRSAGIEQLCPNQITVPPGGKPIMGSWDRALFRIEYPEVYPKTHGPDRDQSIEMGWSVDYASSNPSFIVGLVNYWSERSAYSTDGGKTWTKFASYPPLFTAGKTGGGIAASTPQNIVWFPNSKDDSNPYYTKNGGVSWTQISMPGVPTTGETGWGLGYWFRRHIVAADRVLPNTFYAFNYLKGIFRSTDGGATWTQSPAPVFWLGAYHAKLKTVPGRAGHLFFTSGTQASAADPHPFAVPFMRSKDGGQTWTAIPDAFEVVAFGIGKAKTPSDYPAIYFAGWYKNVYGIYRSTDDAVTWQKIGDYPYGNYDMPITMEGDMDIYGRVYVGHSGSGYSYGQID